MRAEELPHDEAIRLTLARVLVAPAFLYRIEKPSPGAGQGPVTDWELASRLSYFLWSSLPDDELRQAAASGTLHEPDVLVAQAQRMLTRPETTRLATEFGCHWLHIADFDHLDEKSERHFPTFLGLRGAMYEESIHFFTDLFQNDGSVFDILDADYTFLNAPLAKHLRHPDGGPGRRMAASRGRQEVRQGRHPRPGDDAGEAVGRLADQPDLAGQLDQRSPARRRLPRPPKDVPHHPR